MSARLWDWDALVQASGGSPDGVPSGRITGFSIDTRSLTAGDVFVALKDVRDGHDFVTQAFKSGAAAALVGDDYARKAGDGALLRVPDVLQGLEAIGIAARARLPATSRVMAVTGSAGKTGTKEMLRACLATAGRTHAPDKSFNNHWGVPLTLARMPADTQFGIFEIGMNHPGEIRPLAKLVRPHVAIITNVLPVHVGNFPDGEIGVANAKAEIFEGLEPGGTAIILRDSPHFERLVGKATDAGARVRTIGANAGVDARPRLTLHLDTPDGPRTDIQAEIGERFVRYLLATPGQHIATNSLAVLIALETLGKLTDAALAPLQGIGPAKGRGERTQFVLPGGPLLLIDESYNANPGSMQWAVILADAAVDAPFTRGVAVLGDMLELGDGAAKYHEDLGLFIADGLDNLELIFASGPMMAKLFENIPDERRGQWAPRSEDLIDPVLAALRPGDVVIVKGSNGSRLMPIVEAIKKRFAGTEGSV